MPLKEKNLIRHIRRASQRSAAVTSTGAGVARTGIGIGIGIKTGIGDDCAVLSLPPGHELLVTTDFSLENVHFRRDWHAPELIGWRCLTRGLSDIAAMGGNPHAAFLSLALAGDVPQKWVDGFFKGLLDLSKKFNVPLAGGDTAQSPSGIQADIVVVGSIPKGQAVLRSGAKAGDAIYVTGRMGGAAAALEEFMESTKTKPSSGKNAGYFRPMPRLIAGQELRQQKVASAMIDLSDGLSTDLEHICEESGVGAEIEADAIPRAQFGPGNQLVPLDLALNGGDDYELLFTSSKQVASKLGGVPVTRIGRITKSLGMRLIGADGKSRKLKAAGWEHFAAKP